MKLKFMPSYIHYSTLKSLALNIICCAKDAPDHNYILGTKVGTNRHEIHGLRIDKGSRAVRCIGR